MNESGAILIQRRRDTGQWALPGGAQDIGGIAAQCAVRECLVGRRVLDHRPQRDVVTSGMSVQSIGCWDLTGMLLLQHVLAKSFQ